MTPPQRPPSPYAAGCRLLCAIFGAAVLISTFFLVIGLLVGLAIKAAEFIAK